MIPDWIKLAGSAFERLETWKKQYPSFEAFPYDALAATRVLDDLATRLTGNYPFEHPVYAGQMLKPPHDIAKAAYALAMTINPNNHALDGGPPTSEMEKEVIRKLGAMTGFGEGALGHLTSGGTVANLEALWIAGKLHPEKAVGFSKAAHYTHSRMCSVLRLKTVEIPVDSQGVLDIDAFEAVSDAIGTLVVTLGTTGLGNVEPLHKLVPLCQEKGIRIHVDAAYGGFFSLIAGREGIAPEPWEAIARADSIVIDPHKHGLQPYGCGSVIFKDPALGRFYMHDSPYTYFSSDELHLGEISLECSRAGAAAAAFWATLALFPLSETGLGRFLAACRRAAVSFSTSISSKGRFQLLKSPELDIVCYFPFQTGDDAETISRRSVEIFEKGMRENGNQIFVSLYKVDPQLFSGFVPGIPVSPAPVTVLRSVFMKPEHEAAVPDLVARLHRLAENG